jgi:hypothetical protein
LSRSPDENTEALTDGRKGVGRSRLTRRFGRRPELGLKLHPGVLGVCGAKSGVPPANRRLLGAGTEFWHPTARACAAGTGARRALDRQPPPRMPRAGPNRRSPPSPTRRGDLHGAHTRASAAPVVGSAAAAWPAAAKQRATDGRRDRTRSRPAPTARWTDRRIRTRRVAEPPAFNTFALKLRITQRQLGEDCEELRFGLRLTA